MHELGHVLGYDHDSELDAMASTLAPVTRQASWLSPSGSIRDHVFDDWKQGTPDGVTGRKSDLGDPFSAQPKPRATNDSFPLLGHSDTAADELARDFAATEEDEESFDLFFAELAQDEDAQLMPDMAPQVN